MTQKYELRYLTYNCHPETCSHWEHPPVAILKDGKWYRDYDSVDQGKKALEELIGKTKR